MLWEGMFCRVWESYIPGSMVITILGASIDAELES